MYIIVAAKSLDTPYEILHFILMTVGTTVSHWRHQNYLWTHMELEKKIRESLK